MGKGILALLCISLLVSCSPKLKDNFSGKWKVIGGEEILEFSEGETVKAVINSRVAWRGSYKIASLNKSEIKTNLIGSHQEPMTALINNGFLILKTGETKEIARYRRIN